MALTSTADVRSAPADIDRYAVVVAAASLLLVPVARGWVLWSAPGSSGDLNLWVTTSPFDWPLALLVALQVASVLRERTTTSVAPLPVRVLGILLGWMVVCALVHPSWRAVDLAFHIAGAWALVRTARRATPVEQTVLLAVLAALGASQAVLGIAQSRTGDVLGLGVLEFEGPLYTFGSSTAGRGSLTHPYHLTMLLVTTAVACGLLATRLRHRWRVAALAALGTIGVAIPLTFSRAAILAVVAMLVLWATRSATRPVAAVFFLGLAFGALLGTNGIAAKAETTVDVDAADSGRRQRVEEAVRLVEDEPVFGVGPGRYVIALRDVEHDDLLPPHNVVLHAGAEAGVIGGALTTATLIAFALWALRRHSPMVLAAAAALLPFHLLDSYPHVFPVGLLITGMWLAVVVISVADDGEVEAT